MDPQQELFTALLVAIKSKGYDVYDTELPPEGTPYPFVYLGDFRQSDTATKDAVIGSVYPQIHVWHNNTCQRGTVSAMLLDIKTICRRLDRTANFSWLIKNVTQNIFRDTSTKHPLLHGVLDFEMKFS